MSKRLSKLQEDALAALAELQPPWTLTGGAALAGFYLGHRTTRDLDLFWRGQTSITEVRGEVIALLLRSGLQVTELRTGLGFGSIRAQNSDESVVIDLVAEPIASIEPPQVVQHRGHSIQIDSLHEILVNKLCALLHRSEVRDLVDIAALVEGGGDLNRAFLDAPRKDGGFSAVTLGWTLSNWNVASAAQSSGFGDRAAALVTFRDWLLRQAVGSKP